MGGGSSSTDCALPESSNSSESEGGGEQGAGGGDGVLAVGGWYEGNPTGVGIVVAEEAVEAASPLSAIACWS